MHARIAGAVILGGLLSTGAAVRSLAQPTSDQVEPTRTSMHFFGADGIRLTGDMYDPEKPSGAAVILAHAEGDDRSTFRAFAERLARADIVVFNIDLRGHGESRYRPTSSDVSVIVSAGRANYRWQDFTPADWQQLPVDFRAAIDVLRQHRRHQAGRVAVMGSGIGANAAILAAAATPEVRCIVGLSPLPSSRGLSIAEAVDRLRGRSLFAVAARGDRLGYEGAGLLLSAGGQHADSAFPTGQGQGVELLHANPTLADRLFWWLIERLEVTLPEQHPEQIALKRARGEIP